MKLVGYLLALATLFVLSVNQAQAAPPVRIAIVPGGGSGMEQEVCDRISDQLQSSPNIQISTVNPDWYVVCSITDTADLVAQNVRVNGTVTIKSVDGHILNTVSVQTNKQDFNTSPGVAAPMNKALVENAKREVIGGLAQRAIGPIMDAVETEMATREKIIKAQTLGDEDHYAEALDILMTITPETPHFKGARSLIAEFQMEAEAIDLIRQARQKAQQGNGHEAIKFLNAVSPKSKRSALAKSLIAQLSGRRVTKIKSGTAGAKSTNTSAQLKALEAQKRALDAQRRAIEAQESAIKGKSAGAN